MTNYEKYKDELIEMLAMHSTCEQVKYLSGSSVKCNDIDCIKCIPGLIQWLNEDVEETNDGVKMNRTALLEAAEHAVTGDRETDYGTPEQNFARIADLWTAYLCRSIEPHDVAAMMILLKLARVAGGQYKNDNWVDVAGYAACGAELQDNY